MKTVATSFDTSRIADMRNRLVAAGYEDWEIEEELEELQAVQEINLHHTEVCKQSIAEKQNQSETRFARLVTLTVRPSYCRQFGINPEKVCIYTNTTDSLENYFIVEKEIVDMVSGPGAWELNYASDNLAAILAEDAAHTDQNIAFAYTLGKDGIVVRSLARQAAPFERIRRITGYLVGTLDRFNNAKRSEEADRVKHGVPCGCN